MNRRRKQIEKIFGDFLEKRYEVVSNLDLQSLQINPIFLSQLAQQLQWKSIRDVVAFLVNETFQRGTVTSAGFKMEQIAKIFGRETKISGMDFELDKTRPDGSMKTYYVQVKAGPNTIHKDTMEKIRENFTNASQYNPNAETILGITYGKPNQANSFTKELMRQFKVLFGRDFWSFISDDPNCLDKIFQISSYVSTTFRPTGKTLQQLLNDKLDDLTQQWESTYGKLSTSMWSKFL